MPAEFKLQAKVTRFRVGSLDGLHEGKPLDGDGLVRLGRSGIEDEITKEGDGLQEIGFTGSIGAKNTGHAINQDLRLRGIEENIPLTGFGADGELNHGVFVE